MKKMKIINKNAFSLIEIMVVVAIVGMLSQMTYWMYNMYVIRGQVSETFPLVTGPQRLVNSFYQEKGTFPTETSDILEDPVEGKYVSSIEIVSGSSPTILEVTYGNNANNEINGQTLRFEATENLNDIIQWQCVRGTISKNYIPSVCN